MKKTVSIALILLMMAQFFGQLGTMAWFSLNRQSIAEQYCENKSLPESCCYGKCYLGKQLSGLEKDAAQPSRTVTENDIPLFLLPVSGVWRERYPVALPYTPFRGDALPSGFPCSAEQPPETILA